MTQIRPELLTARLQAARHLEDPRLQAELNLNPRFTEMLWFIQAPRPGGLAALTAHLLERYPGKFITLGMQRAGPLKSGAYSLHQCLAVWKSETPSSYFYDLRRFTQPFYDWLWSNIDQLDTEESLRRDTHRREALRVGLEQFNYEYFNNECIEAAKADLPKFFRSLCEDVGGVVCAPWYCPDLYATLGSFMDEHRSALERSIAPTEVQKIIFRELEFSCSERVPAQIVGPSRFGKTACVQTWCDMRPGRARLVTVPDSNKGWDFYAALADAFGMAHTDKTRPTQLERSVKYICQHSGLFLVFDESQFLLPTSYSENTRPKRLNWVRCQVIDPPGSAGCAFFATKQSYKQDLDKYVRKTGFVMEQWLGRMAPIVTLPAELGRSDLLQVARLHFPEVPQEYLELIAAHAALSEGYLKNLDITAKRVRFNAREAGRARIALEDVEAAIADVMPGIQPKRPAPAEAPPRPCSPRASGPRRESQPPITLNT